MVDIKAIHDSNEKIKDLPASPVAVFIGATSGICEEALKQFAQHAKTPRIYIIGRKAAAAAPLMDDLKQKNPNAELEFIEKDASLIRDIDAVCSTIKAKEKKLDFLFLSAGFISFVGRQETPEGLDASMSTRYYVRMRAIQNLLPLLRAAPSPRVVSVLAGGMEGKLVEDDLDLRKAGNYSILNAATHSATMGTLTLGHFAVENPSISFVHSYPGAVATTTFSKGTTGVVGFLMKWIVAPVVNLFFAISAQEAGSRVLFYGTSARYAVEGGAGAAVPLVQGVEKATPTEKGVFLLDAKGESSGDKKLLEDFEKRGVSDAVWTWTEEVFNAVSAAA